MDRTLTWELESLRLEIDIPDGFDPAVRSISPTRRGYQQSMTTPGSAIIVDFAARVVLEERDATLAYRIYQNNTLVLEVSGANTARTYRSGSEEHRGVRQLISFGSD